MPWTCFSYPTDAPPGLGRRDAAQPDSSGPYRMTYTACFNYAVDLSPVTGTSGAAEAAPSGPRRPITTCFSY